MSIVMLNEDTDHFMISRYYAGIPVTYESLCDYIDQYQGTDVTDLVFNPNGMLAFYPSQRIETIYDRYEEILAGKEFSGRSDWLENVYNTWKVYKLDQWRIWLDRTRQNGLRGWLSIRMNDIHDAFDAANYGHSRFFLERPELYRVSHHSPIQYHDKTLDIGSTVVRERLLAIVDDFCDLYTFDGLELDFMREIYGVKVGHEYDTVPVMVDFISQVRARINRYAKEQGRSVQLSLRIPSRPETSLRWGIDAVTLVKRHLIDRLIVTPRWQTIETDIPVDLWRSILDDTGVILLAGLEILIESSRNRPWSEYEHYFNSTETATAAVAAYLSLGADGVYLFNYMDFAKLIPEEESLRECVTASKHFHKFLCVIGDKSEAIAAKRRHVVTFSDICAPGVPPQDILPFTCNPPSPVTGIAYQEARLLNGHIDPHSSIYLIIGIVAERELMSEDLDVYINTLSCSMIGKTQLTKVYPTSTTYRFMVPNPGQFSPISIIEVASLKIPFTVDWLELQVNMEIDEI